MKLAVQLGLLPGASTRDKFLWAADHGVEGVEIPNRREDHAKALKEFSGHPVRVCSICGNPSFDFLDPDPRKRQASIAQCKENLKLAGDLGAVGQIVPPIFGPPRIPNLSPWMDAVSIEKALLVEECKELGEWAKAHGTLLLLEPLNRYEQHLLRRQADGVEIIERAGHDGVRLISDFFHMHIEETDTPAAIRAAGKYVKHVHLADNTRLEPGTGDIDFVAGFRALLDIGFDGYMAYECKLSGDDKAASLAKSLDYLRDCLNQARKAA